MVKGGVLNTEKKCFLPIKFDISTPITTLKLYSLLAHFTILNRLHVSVCDTVHPFKQLYNLNLICN